MVEVRVPAVGESITEVEIGDWLKAPGQPVVADEPLVVLETEKASLELPSPAAGVLAAVRKQKGERARIGEVIAELAPATASPAAPAVRVEPALAAAPAPAAPPSAPASPPAAPASPASAPAARPAPAPAVVAPASPAAAIPDSPAGDGGGRGERTVPMTALRRRVAERLVQAQQAAALLTTFNEMDMSAVSALRRAHQERFRERHGVRLGLMSFFVRATVAALARVPELNAEVRGTDVVYRDYCDMGIAVAGARGLVVPVLRHAERMSFADIERAIGDFAARAASGRLLPDELIGGTFSITNGGVFGSLLSTPIVNPPQSGILGLHVIQDRPVARDGQVVIRPMMYVALTYDHRVVDGREAVTFLRTVKESVEDPARLLLGV
jgi:2-oxoglutarate dehydrogenase E2 component (dihydrolipoamide succinyltransferase)